MNRKRAVSQCGAVLFLGVVTTGWAGFRDSEAEG